MGMTGSSQFSAAREVSGGETGTRGLLQSRLGTEWNLSARGSKEKIRQTSVLFLYLWH